MNSPGHLGYARRLVIGFVAIAGGLTIALGLLSWRFLSLEEDLDEQRIRRRLEAANDSAVGIMVQAVAESERWLQDFLVADEAVRSGLVTGAGRSLPSDSVVLVLRGEEIAAYPPSTLIYYPFDAGPDRAGHAPPDAPATRAMFDQVDVLEHRDGDFDAAATRLRELADTQKDSVRAEALLRLGRVMRRQGNDEGALSVYEDLEEVGDVWVEDQPAALWAGVNRCEVLARLGRTTELRAAAQSLLESLRSGRWRLTAGTYRFYAGKVEIWLDGDASAAPSSSDREALAAAVEEVWRATPRASAGAPEKEPRRSIVWAQEHPFALLTAADDQARAVLLAGPQFVAQHWAAGWKTAAENQGVEIALVEASSGRVLLPAWRSENASAPGNGGLEVKRTPDETGLPWSVHVSSLDETLDRAGLARRRNILLVGLTLVTCIVLTSIYFISRAATREFEVARVQSDFVAAVSHEFRSPLTSMRHMIELLASDRVPDDNTRARFYGVLEREAHRLQRLVEQLLDFRRLDEGAVAFDMQPLDVTELVEDVVAAFHDDANAHGSTLKVATKGPLPRIRGDREALSRMLWNLLDNAARYSPDCDTVWLDVARTEDWLAIAVRDRGIGIPDDEQATIFRKFVRGAGGQALGARGTGLGLAMVDEIVRAHGGRITLESEAGKGTTFIVELPLEIPTS